MAKQSYANYNEYWVDFLRKHAHRGTRFVHYIATLIALGPGLYGLFTLHWVMAAAGFGGSYVLALLSHHLIEKDRPMAGKPGWGAYSDLRMCALALCGKLDAERKRHGLI